MSVNNREVFLNQNISTCIKELYWSTLPPCMYSITYLIIISCPLFVRWMTTPLKYLYTQLASAQIHMLCFIILSYQCGEFYRQKNGWILWFIFYPSGAHFLIYLLTVAYIVSQNIFHMDQTLVSEFQSVIKDIK